MTQNASVGIPAHFDFSIETFLPQTFHQQARTSPCLKGLRFLRLTSREWRILVILLTSYISFNESHSVLQPALQLPFASWLCQIANRVKYPRRRASAAPAHLTNTSLFQHTTHPGDSGLHDQPQHTRKTSTGHFLRAGP